MVISVSLLNATVIIPHENSQSKHQYQFINITRRTLWTARILTFFSQRAYAREYKKWEAEKHICLACQVVKILNILRNITWNYTVINTYKRKIGQYSSEFPRVRYDVHRLRNRAGKVSSVNARSKYWLRITRLCNGKYLLELFQESENKRTFKCSLLSKYSKFFTIVWVTVSVFRQLLRPMFLFCSSSVGFYYVVI